MIEQFFNFNNPFFWFGMVIGVFYGLFALKIKVLGGNPRNFPILDSFHQFLVNFPGGFTSGFLLWSLFKLDFLKEPLLFSIVLLFFFISISGYLPHFVINILLGGKGIIELINKLLGR